MENLLPFNFFKNGVIMKTIRIDLSKEELEICWVRVIDNMIESLSENYIYFDDVFELRELLDQVDYKVRLLKKD